MPTVAVFCGYLAVGHVDAYIYANFLSIFGRHRDVAADQVDNALTALAILGPLIAMAGAGLNAVASRPEQPVMRHFLYGWFFAALVGFTIFGSWYNHYTLSVMLPGCVCSAGFLAKQRTRSLIVAPALLALFLLGQRIVAANVDRRGTVVQFDAVIKAIGPGPGSLYVDWGEPAFYTFTGRRALSPYLFPTHLQLVREAGAIGVDQISEVNRILSRRPDVVVLMGPPTETKEDFRIFARVWSFVHEGAYDAPTKLSLGRLSVSVYHRTDKKGAAR